MQCGVGTDRHVRAHEVIVNGTDDAGDVHLLMAFGHIRGDLAGRHQFLQEAWPLLAQHVRAGQGAVPADRHDAIDSSADEVLDCGALTRALPEFGAARGSDGGSALIEDVGDVRPSHLGDEVAALNGAAPPLADGIRHRAFVDRRSGDGADHGIHALGVTARGQDRDLRWFGFHDILRKPTCTTPIVPSPGRNGHWTRRLAAAGYELFDPSTFGVCPDGAARFTASVTCCTRNWR